MGRTHLHRRGQLVLVDVDGNDGGGPGDASSLERREAHATDAEHRDRRSRLDLGRPKDGAQASGDAAADQRQGLQRKVLLHLDDGALGHQHALGEARQVGELGHGLAALAQTRRGVFGPALAIVTEVGVIGQTHLTLAAPDRGTGDDMVARRDVPHVRAHRFDDARGLVSQHHRPLHRNVGVDDVEIAAAHAAGCRPQQNLVLHRVVDVDLFDGQRLVGLVVDRGFHGTLLYESVERFRGSIIRGASGGQTLNRQPSPSLTRRPAVGAGKCVPSTRASAPPTTLRNFLLDD